MLLKNKKKIKLDRFTKGLNRAIERLADLRRASAHLPESNWH